MSLLGISIGILCLISVFSAVDSLERNLRKSIDSLGGDVIYVGKWPWIMAEDYPWWKFVNRPEISIEDFEALQDRVSLAKGVALWRWVKRGTLKYESEYVESISMFAVTSDYDKVKDIDFAAGRYLSPSDFSSTQNNTFIGFSIAEALFSNAEMAIGKEFTFGGIPLHVVGVMKKEGQDVLGINKGFGLDNTIYVSDNFASAYVATRRSTDPSVLVRVKDGIAMDELEAELGGLMRIIRGLKPKEDDNFALNKVSVFTKMFDQLFAVIYIVGLVIGFFSIVVGAFGISNIMFVSVKERTSIIGVKKALGAKKIYILFEFIIEAVLLCLFGGAMGLLLVVGLFKVLGIAMQGGDFELIISQKNIIIGLLISITAGLIAGIVPALQAANMRPVDAIRS